MNVKHSVFAHHVLVNTYHRCFFERFDGIYYLSLQWGVNGLCAITSFRSLRSLCSFVDSLPDGRAKRSFKFHLQYVTTGL